jgi:MYXO-CTERM domain-containing protein
VSLGVGRVEGPRDAYTGFNVWGGLDPETPATFGGKSYGILSVAGILYMWVAPGSGAQGYASQTLQTSDDHGLTWTAAPWQLVRDDGWAFPTFAQFEQDYAGARDEYVYVYLLRIQDDSALVVHTPGEVDLARVPADAIADERAYEWWAGADTWSSDRADAEAVLENPEGVGWNLSVSYNAPAGRYLLATEHTATMLGNLAIFDAPEPWGPWTTVVYLEGFGAGEIETSAFFWNFSNKWLSADGTDFVLVFTGVNENDSWNTVEGSWTVTPVDEPGDTDGTTESGGGTQTGPGGDTTGAGPGTTGTTGGTASATGNATASGGTTAPSETDTEAGLDGGGTEDDGCGCRSETEFPGALWLLVLAGAIRWRRAGAIE